MIEERHPLDALALAQALVGVHVELLFVVAHAVNAVEALLVIVPEHPAEMLARL